MGMAYQRRPKAPTLSPVVASKGCVRKRTSDGRGEGYSLCSAWSAVTSPSPAAPASLVELPVALMNFLLRLHLLTFNIRNIPRLLLYVQN